MTLTNAGAPHATLAAIIWLGVAAVLIVGPSYALLLTLQGRRLLGGGEQAAPPATTAGRAGPPAADQPPAPPPGPPHSA